MYYQQPIYYGYYPYPVYPTGYFPTTYQGFYDWDFESRQQVIRGEATWTYGGSTTKCGLPWSTDEYMTVAVGDNTPYQCGQTIKVRNPMNGREIIVTVVDQVEGYPSNRLNLHRRAFEALGANPGQGVIGIEIMPSPELEEEKWGKYLLELVETAYPDFDVTDYNATGKTELSSTKIKETFDFILQTPEEEEIKIKAYVIYNPKTDRVLSFNFDEV